MATDGQTRKATWHGPFEALMPNGVVLETGDEYEVTEADLQSSHWRPVKSSTKKDAD